MQDTIYQYTKIEFQMFTFQIPNEHTTNTPKHLIGTYNYRVSVLQNKYFRILNYRVT